MIVHILVFLAALFVLIKSSDYFVRGAERAGLAMGLSPFATGVLIVGIGTSLPELISSVIAAAQGTPEIVSGNAVGSNIANILLVLAVASIFSKKLEIKFDILKNDLPAILVSSIFLFFASRDGRITKIETAAFLILLAAYFFFSSTGVEKTEQGKTDNQKAKINLATIALLLLPPFGIFFGAKYTVQSVISLSTLLGINPEVIALSAVSIGTSLPEIIVTIQAARRGQGEMAIGNVTGSNIFNIFGVMGISGLFGSYAIPRDIVSFSIPFLLAITLLYVFMILDKKIVRLEGVFLLILYGYFILTIFGIPA